jgi:hypothetical protein
MHVYKDLIRAKKQSKEELKARVMQLQKEVMQLEEVVCELQHRVTHLENMRKLGN